MEISMLIDIGIVVILLISAAVSFYRGLIREVLTIFGVLGGLLAAIMFGSQLKPYTHQWFGVIEGKEPGKLFDLIPANIAADATAYLMVFVVVFLTLQLASYFLSSSAHAIGLGPIDRTLGVLFGIARGVILLGLIYLPFHLILSDENKKDWFAHSKTIPYVEKLTLWILSYVPTDQSEDGKKADHSEARQKLMDLDLLGDKRISKDLEAKPTQERNLLDEDSKNSDNPVNNVTSPNPNDGYENNERKGMDQLILKGLSAPDSSQKSPEEATKNSPTSNAPRSGNKNYND